MMLDKFWIDTTLNLLWKLALFMGIPILSYLIVTLFTKTDTYIQNNSSLLAALFILLSASIASTSIMKSILENKKLKDDEINALQKSQLLYLLHIFSQLKYKNMLYVFMINKLYDSVKYRTLTQDELNKINDNFTYNYNLWRKIFYDKYFIYFDDKGYKLFEHISHAFYETEAIFDKKEDYTNIYLILLHAKDIESYIDSMIKNISNNKLLKSDTNQTQ